MWIIAPLVCGLIFGAGLLISGMVQPTKVLGFLDIFGAWDPSLAVVMAAALAVAVPGFRLADRGGYWSEIGHDGFPFVRAHARS